MHKIIFFILIHISILTSLNAKEPTLAILLNVISNDTQKFGIGNYSFYCSPYGVVTLERLFNNAAKGSICQKSILGFYKKNPTLEYFTDGILDVRQTYHLEFKDERCVLYAKGEMTLSELLLKKGLAVVKPQFKDDEFIYSYQKAEFKAKIDKDGLWNSKILKECVSELSKE